MRPYDQLALPRCPETSLRLPIGAWEYRRETSIMTILMLIMLNWRIVHSDDTAVLLKYTHSERIE